VPWTLLKTPLGDFGLAWKKDALTRVLLPGIHVRARLKAATGEGRPSAPPPWVRKLMKRIGRHLRGDLQDFSEVPIELAEEVPEFHQRVYVEALRVAPGQVMSYGDLACAVGEPQLARAVGQAMKHNPISFVIPCHRIIAAGEKLGGYTAEGGLTIKARLLECEGIRLAPAPRLRTPMDLKRALPALRAADSVIARLIRECEIPDLRRRSEGTPYSVLFEAIIGQQLSTAAARTIRDRIRAIVGGARMPSPGELERIPDDRLRQAGLSRGKVRAVRDLAAREAAGFVPTETRMRTMTDDAIVRRLTEIHGVGRWTVEMMLIFYLGRADVFAVHDYALRVAIGRAHGLRNTPTPERAGELARKWAPHRTVASLYLWKSLEKKA
jgi:methylated-DNA-[protein]-cysteine S-methyltransferase